MRSRYAAMVRGDRELRLIGYELYRFGALELGADTATETVEKFFAKGGTRRYFRSRSRSSRSLK